MNDEINNLFMKGQKYFQVVVISLFEEETQGNGSGYDLYQEGEISDEIFISKMRIKNTGN